MNNINVGDMVTCRPDGKLRGCIIKKINNDNVMVDACNFSKRLYPINHGDYVLSSEFKKE